MAHQANAGSHVARTQAGALLRRLATTRPITFRLGSDFWPRARTRLRAPRIANSCREPELRTAYDRYHGCRCREPRSALVLSSGVHGVEGLFGSAVQLAFLEQLAPDWRPPRCGGRFDSRDQSFRFRLAAAVQRRQCRPESQLSCLPKSNSRGAAALRRVSQDDEAGPAADAVRLLDGAHGDLGALSRHPIVLGNAACRAVRLSRLAVLRRTCGRADRRRRSECFLPTLLDEADEVVHLDFHTGLGRWAECELLGFRIRRTRQLRVVDRAFRRRSWLGS